MSGKRGAAGAFEDIAVMAGIFKKITHNIKNNY